MNDNMKEDVLRVLLSEEEIRAKVRELGAQDHGGLQGQKPDAGDGAEGRRGVSGGSDASAIDVPAEIDFMVVSSYGSGVKSSAAW